MSSRFEKKTAAPARRGRNKNSGSPPDGWQAAEHPEDVCHGRRQACNNFISGPSRFRGGARHGAPIRDARSTSNSTSKSSQSGSTSRSTCRCRGHPIERRTAAASHQQSAIAPGADARAVAGERAADRLRLQGGGRKNTLRGFSSVEFSSGLGPVHVHPGGRAWVALPGKPVIDEEGRHKRAEGKAVYTPVAEWSSRDISDRFSEIVIGLLRDRYGPALDVGTPPS